MPQQKDENVHMPPPGNFYPLVCFVISVITSALVTERFSVTFN